jgi:hypothetical protein
LKVPFLRNFFYNSKLIKRHETYPKNYLFGRKGLIYRISNVLFENNFNIDRNDEFVDSEKNLFFMRTEFSGDCEVQNLKINSKIFPEDAKINCL